MDSAERWHFEDDNSHNPEPVELGLCSPVFGFDNIKQSPSMIHSTFTLDGPMIGLEEAWTEPAAIHNIADSWPNAQTIFNEPVTSIMYPSYQPAGMWGAGQSLNGANYIEHGVPLSPSSPVIEPHSILGDSASQSDSERSERSNRSNKSSESGRTNVTLSSLSSGMETTPGSGIYSTLYSAETLKRPRLQRKRRMTSSDEKPVALMDEEEKRERNKQSASDYRKRRKNYVHDLENRLDTATFELSRKEEALRAALNEIAALKDQMGFMQTIALKREGQVSIPIASDLAAQPQERCPVVSAGASRGRRGPAGKGAMSLAMLTLLSCFLCQFGFFDSSIGPVDVGFAATSVPFEATADIPVSAYSAGAPDCSVVECNKNRFLYWEDDNQPTADEIIDLDVETAKIEASLAESPLPDLDVESAVAQMSAVVNATETDWLVEGTRTPMGFLDADSYMEASDRELGKSLDLDNMSANKGADLIAMIAGLFQRMSAST